MLLQTILRSKCFTSLGDRVGKLVELYLEEGTWEIKYAALSRGFWRHDRYYPITYLIVGQGKNITILPENVVEAVDEEVATALLPATHFLGCEVVGKNDRSVGKLYDIDLFIRYKKWSFWKILIRSGIKERRLRLDASLIGTVGKTLILTKTLAELQEDDES